MVTGKYINTAIFYLLQSYFNGCHGNIIIMLSCTNFVQSDAHIIPTVKNNNYKYYLWLIVVAMAIAMGTIVVDNTCVQGSMVIGIITLYSTVIS